MLLLAGCRSNNDSVYERIRKHAEGILVINTHEHQHIPADYGNYKFRFYHLLAASYLAADVTSSGADASDWAGIDTLDSDQAWDVYGKALDYSRTTSYYYQFAEGFRELYELKDPYFTRENINSLSSEIEENYKDYNEWFDKAFRKTGYQLMILDQYWKPFNRDIDQKHFALAFNINLLVSSAAKKPGDGLEIYGLYREAARQNYTINNFDDYLSFCDTLFRENLRKKAVCIKNAMAYSRSLFYEDVSYEEAKLLYDRPSASLSPAEAKKIEDFMFHFIIRKAADYNLPIQIHTGYLAGNGNVLDNGYPLKLNNLFIKYPEAKFIIFHGGFPWTGECAALAKMFPNVYLDLVWLPQISMKEAVRSLDLMLDCVPYNKFCWGGDCGLIEESAGSLSVARDVVSEVLAGRVKRGLLSEDIALEITDRIFRKNAIEIFDLEPKLGLK
jgi:hypothetical protein